MRFLDTNIFVRFLTGDDLMKAEACRDLFERLASGEETATTAEVVLAEVAYVLSGRGTYRLSQSEIAARLRPLVLLRGMNLPHKRMYLRALDLYEAHSFLDFEDAVNIAHMERLGIDEIASYDKDFDAIPTIGRVEP